VRGPLHGFLPIVFGALLAAALVRGETGGFRSPAAGQRLLPGTVVEVDWSCGPATGEADEMELVLSLDGGRTFPVRVSGKLEPSATRIGWRVPSLATLKARLALRAGEREEGSERIRIVSSEFEIRPDPSSPEEDLLRVAGEWRTRTSLLLPESELPTSRTLEPKPTVFAGTDPNLAGVSPRTDQLEAPRPKGLEAPVSDGAAAREVGASPIPVRLAPLPLRE
jgi:hypothetical protein